MSIETAKKWLYNTVKHQHPTKKPFVKVYTGTRKGSPWSNTTRETSDYQHFEMIDDQDFYVRLFGDWKTVVRELADILFSDDDIGLVRSLFPEQILTRTQNLTGQKDRRSATQMIIDVLAHHLIPKDLAFLISRLKTETTGSLLLRRCLNYTNMASIWAPSDINKLYDRAAKTWSKLKVVALAGSWASPIIAAEKRNDISKLKIYDVIDDYEQVVSNFSIPIILDLGGSEKSPDKSEYEKYNLVIWNPPYWGLEQYDAEYNDGELQQNEKQSTSNKNETFQEWLDRFVYKSAKTAFKLLKTGGLFYIVVPSSIQFHNSFRKEFNPEGMVKNTGNYSIPNFDLQIQETVSKLAFTHVERQVLRKFTRGTFGNCEILHVFQK
jgi:hypothetical protein